MLDQLIKDIYQSPSAFQAIDNMSAKFDEAGFIRLNENTSYDNLEAGKNYYVSRNGSSILAFKLGSKMAKPKFKIVSSHSDCPSFKLKPHAIIKDGKNIKLNTEVYGGAIYSCWLDRPLSLAGRLICKCDGQFRVKTFDLKEPFCLIPNVAIHVNREINNGYKYNPQVDLLPLVTSDQEFDLNKFLCEKAGVDEVLNFDLYLYPFMEGTKWGDYFSSFHIDNLECGYTSLYAFLDSHDEENINVYCCFDNEEVGSLTKQGAHSDFMANNLKRIAKALDYDYEAMVARSYMVSADNAHAVHPNMQGKADPTNAPVMNGGIVIKYNANQSYTSDAYSASILTEILNSAKVPYQFFTNRSDARGGSTLGNISNAQVSLTCVDIGLAQLAMHSCYETAGAKDVNYMIEGLKAFYNNNLDFANL